LIIAGRKKDAKKKLGGRVKQAFLESQGPTERLMADLDLFFYDLAKSQNGMAK
jgi:hypothetical protein